MIATESLAAIRHYYGNVLQLSSDLKTGACGTIRAVPEYLFDCAPAPVANAAPCF